ncbi:MAG TPA: glycoside hydrolase family 16 protein [Burkholderiales bacterium]|nr:glycoside hydrolase family 16 protein [Burkholderiales bacterium]
MTTSSAARRGFIQQSGAIAGGLAFSPALAQPADIVLDFRGALPSSVQFRRNGPATFVASDGVLHAVQDNVPRFPDHDGKPLGLLIEGEATNFLVNASRPDARGWSPGAGPIGSAAATVIAPDGRAGVYSIQRPPPAVNSIYDAVITNAPWTEYATASVWLRSTSGSGKWRLRLRDFTTYNGVATVVEVSPSWRRYAVGFAWQIRDTGAKRFSVLYNEILQPSNVLPPIYALNRVNPYERVATPLTLDNVLMWGAQYEVGNDASTFIPTVDGPSTRKADEVTFPTSGVNAANGSLTIELPLGGRRGGVILDAAGDRGGIRIAYSNSGWITARVGDIDLSGFGDVTRNRIVRLEWSKEGVQILTGDRLTALTRQAAQRRATTLNLGAAFRLGMAQDGAQPLGRVIAKLTISKVTGSVGQINLPAIAPAAYVQSFHDDFEDSDLGRINENASGSRAGAPAWRSRYRHGRQAVINKEKQIYMDPLFAGTAGSALGVQPFSIQGGVLRIRADKADPVRVSPYIWNYRYTSGCISSELTHWQTYGYFEMRARLPRGKGYWPAFWLLPKRTAWPPEIDVLEASGARPYGVRSGVLEKPRAAKTPGGLWIDQFIDTSDGFHTYALEWTAENLIFFVDGTKTFDYGAHNIHEDMYMIVNLALGSHDPNWIPDPDDTTPFPGVMEIDYVHAYRRGV